MTNKNVEWVYFQGKGSWFKNLQQGDNEYKNWNVKLHFLPQSYDAFMQLKERDGDVEGIMNEVKRDDDGYYHLFKRPMFKDFGMGEEPLLPPEIVDADNQPWDRNTLIGNGSDITIKCECYKYTNRRTKKRGKAIRLVAVMINNLVPYSKDDFTANERIAIEGLSEQPKHLF